MLEGRIFISGLMLLIFASAVGVSFTYDPDARFLPLVIGIPGLILSLIQFITELRDRSKRKNKPGELARELRMFAWFVGFVGGLIVFGFLYAGPLLVAAYLYFAGKEKWYVALGACVGCWVILYFVFDQFLGLPPWEGLVFQWLYG
jgi:hypothetical protein